MSVDTAAKIEGPPEEKKPKASQETIAAKVGASLRNLLGRGSRHHDAMTHLASGQVESPTGQLEASTTSHDKQELRREQPWQESAESEATAEAGPKITNESLQADALSALEINGRQEMTKGGRRLVVRGLVSTPNKDANGENRIEEVRIIGSRNPNKNNVRIVVPGLGSMVIQDHPLLSTGNAAVGIAIRKSHHPDYKRANDDQKAELAKILGVLKKPA